ncbi:TAXI family TRAP transporter solute-binding subunit [Rhodosalinus sp. K401]|uniref:TAXI family TRAP transporter solute-binding subunit n=1 Tax=Rhodosalinus sp. K401 TaxID=3239195 RepID=UPI003526A032
MPASECAIRCRPVAAALVLMVAVAFQAPPAGAEQLRFFTLGTAALTGNYYAAGRAICRVINREGPADLRCSPEPTPGSQYNLLALEKGELDFAFVQSDWQHRAHEGRGAFAGAAMKELRSVMSLYAEAVTLVARTDAGIGSVNDLAGKTVDLGNPSTARRGTNVRVLSAIGIDTGLFGRITELSSATVGPELCAGRIDAALIVIGHPNAQLAELLELCELQLVSIDGPAVRDFVDKSADFETYAITPGTYQQVRRPVRTVSTVATLVTRSQVSDDLVAHVARTVIARYETLAEQVPALGTRDLEKMRRAGLTAPLHPAAAAVFDASPGGPDD